MKVLFSARNLRQFLSPKMCRSGGFLFAATLGCGLLLAGCSGGVKPPGKDVGTTLNLAVPSDIAHLPLFNAKGQKTSLADFHGKTVVISDMLTLCQETCPMDTANMVRTAREVNKAGNGKDVVFLSITVDPVRDTKPQISAYRKLFAPAPPNWHVLSGSAKNVHKLWKQFGVYWQRQKQDSLPPKNWRTGKTLTFDIAHSDEVIFLDRNGRERFMLEGAGNVQGHTKLPPKIYHFLSDEGRHNLKHPDKQTWTVPQALKVIKWLRLGVPLG